MSKFGDYRFHESADIFPMMAGEEWNAFQADVEANGFRDKITFWMNGKDEKIYLDGRNRVKAAVEIRKTNPEFPFPPEEEFTGPESKVLDLVLSKNLQGRRHLKSGQIAASAAAAGYLMNLYAKREKSEVIADLGDLATYLAKRLGTNRTYVYKTLRIRDHRRDLLNRIIKGELNIPEAEREWKADVEAAARESGESESTITDGRGNPADPRFEEVFAARDQFEDVMKLIRAAKGGIKGLSGLEAGGEWFDAKEALAQIENAESRVKAAMPYAVCPGCMGEKKVNDPTGGKRKVRCRQCEKNGYVNEARFSGESAEVANLTPVPDEAAAGETPDAPPADAA